MYGVDLSVQFENLMPALGLGFILAFLYDIVRFLRLVISQGKVFMFVTDMIYVIFCALSSFLLFLAVNSGHIRSYLVLAEILAATVYRFTAGTLIFVLFERIAAVIKKTLKLIFLPFDFVRKKITLICLKLSERIKKTIKKIKINSKNPLKDTAEL